MINKIKLCCCFLLLSLAGFSNPDKEKCTVLIQSGTKAKQDKNYIQALKYYSQANLIAEANQWPDRLWVIRNNMGLVYSSLSNYDEALEHFNQALKVIEQSPELLEKKAYTYTNIGVLYNKEKDHKAALSYFLKAYDIARQQSPALVIKTIAINIADCYNAMHEIKKATAILEEYKAAIGDSRVDKAWQITYAENLLLQHNTKAAKKIGEGLFPQVSELDDGECYFCIIELLYKTYKAENNKDKAIHYIRTGLLLPIDLNDRITLYDELSDLYMQKDNYYQAGIYKDSVIVLKDSLSSLINHNYYEANKVKLQVNEYKNDLRLAQEKFYSEKLFYRVLLVCGLIIMLLLYKGIRVKIKKQQRQKTLLENQQKITDLEVENISNSVAEKTRKLTAKALYMSGRNKLISDVTQMLLGAPKVLENKVLSAYINSLQSQLKTQSEWDEFIEHFKEVNPGFLAALEQRHPNLSNNDLRFICYLYMNISIKEISTILNISYNASKIRKRRILEKMGLEKETSLYDYIRQI